MKKAIDVLLSERDERTFAEDSSDKTLAIIHPLALLAG